MAYNTEDGSKPDFVKSSHAAALDDVGLCRDVYGGTRKMRKRGKDYLPQFPRETDAGWRTRNDTAVLFNAFKRTVFGLIGMVVRKDPEPGEDAPEDIKMAWEDIDLGGRHGSVFAADLLRDALVDGFVLVFVDRPRLDGVASAAEESERGRPYWVEIRKQNLLRWRFDRIDGKLALGMIAWQGCETEPDGEFGETEVEAVWQFSRDEAFVSFQKWVKRKDSKGEENWEPSDSGTMGIEEIPVAVLYGGQRDDSFVCDPPLLDLAFENVDHYQKRSDYANTLHIAGVPIPVFTGIDEEEGLGVGSDHGLVLPTGASAGYMEPTGASLEATRTELQDVETRMAVLGLAMLKPETRAAETAESKRLDKSEKDSALSRVARSLQDCLEQCARFHMRWLGQTEVEVGFSVSQDFSELALTPQEIGAFSAMVEKKQLSLDTMWELLKTGEVLPDGFDVDEEKKKIAAATEEAMSRAQKMGLGGPGAKEEDEPGPPGPPEPEE